MVRKTFCVLIIVLSQSVNAEIKFFPVPHHAGDRDILMPLNEVSSYVVSSSPAAFTMEVTTFSTPEAVETESVIPSVAFYASAIESVKNDDLEQYKTYSASGSAYQNAFANARRVLLPQIPLEDPLLATGTWQFGGLTSVRLSGLRWTEAFVKGAEGYKLYESQNAPALSMMRAYANFASLNPTAASEVDVAGMKSITTSYCLSDTCTNNISLYFNGWIPAWGRRVLEDGQFIIDAAESEQEDTRRNRLVRFIRDNWRLYNEIPDSSDLVQSAARKAYFQRLSEDMRNILEFRWIQNVEETPFRRQFENRFKWIRLLYIIDCDPIYAVIWLPNIAPPQSESYSEHGFGIMYATPRSLDHYGVDIIQRVDESFFINNHHSVIATPFYEFLMWEPIQLEIMKFVKDEYDQSPELRTQH